VEPREDEAAGYAGPREVGGTDLEAGCLRKVAHGAAGGSGTRSGRRRSRVGEKKERGEGDGAGKWGQCHVASMSTKPATKTV